MEKEVEGGEWKRKKNNSRGGWKRRMEEEVKEQAGRIGWLWRQDWWRKTDEER